MHIEFLVEEPSCVEVLHRILPKIIGDKASWRARIFQGKKDLLECLPNRLRGYARSLPTDWRIVVLVDLDNDDCGQLKARLEETARAASLVTRCASRDKKKYQVLNRIVIEELEAWFFGDVGALAQAYRGLTATLARKKRYRDPDTISGGTAEALERELQKAGYYQTHMPKTEVARRVAEFMQPDHNRSRSFQVFRDALREMVV